MHFCIYWTQEYSAQRDKAAWGGPPWDRRFYPKGARVMRKRHALVGRTINTVAASTMAQYLEGAIDRLLRERLTDSEGKLNHKELWSRWGISFREGAADAVMLKISEKVRKLRADEEKRLRAMSKAAKAGGSSETALSLVRYIDAEHDANIDFIHGEGTSARWAKERMERAEQRRKAQEEYVKWAAANPEEARKQEEELTKSRRRYRGGSGTREREKDWGAYSAGERIGKTIGLDRPVDARKVSGLL
jgi:hypothetical protein